MPFDYTFNTMSADLAKIGLEWGYQGDYGINKIFLNNFTLSCSIREIIHNLSTRVLVKKVSSCFR